MVRHKKSVVRKKRPSKRKAREEEKFGDVMEEFGKGKLRSGSKRGPKVKKYKQAIAIAFSEAKRAKKRSTKKRK